MTQYSTLFVFSTILLATACVTPVQIDFAEAEQELVVYSHFGGDEAMKIYLSHTRDPLKPNERFNPIEEATIRVYRDSVLVSSSNRMPDEKVEYAALYEVDVETVVGSEYKIEIVADGYKNIQATETVPRQRVDTRSFSFVEETEESKIFQLLFSDDDSVENYYQLVVKVIECSREGEILKEEAVDYQINRSSNFMHFEAKGSKKWEAIYPKHAGYLFTGVPSVAGFKELLIEIPNEGRLFGGGVTDFKYRVELYNVSDSYFLYHQSVKSQLTNENPLDEPVRIFNNIEGGFGNFSAYNRSLIESPIIGQ